MKKRLFKGKKQYEQSFEDELTLTIFGAQSGIYRDELCDDLNLSLQSFVSGTVPNSGDIEMNDMVPILKELTQYWELEKWAVN